MVRLDQGRTKIKQDRNCMFAVIQRSNKVFDKMNQLSFTGSVLSEACCIS